jgi:hypothetical protein
MPSKSMKAKIILVKIEQDGDMFVATSPDMKGLLVCATSYEKIEAAVTEAIRNMYLACGVDVVVSKAEDGTDALEPWIAFPAELARRQTAA